VADNYSFLTKITDPGTRSAMKAALDRLAALEKQTPNMGRVTQALQKPLNGGNQYLQNIKDPLNPQDAVTLNYLQTYVANAFRMFKAEQALAGGTGGVPSDSCVDFDGKPFVDNIPDHSSTVTAIWNSAPLGPASSELDKYHFARAVAIALETVDAPLTCGLLQKDSGANIYACSGVSYSISRVCFSNGHIFKILVDADPGGANTPTWSDNCGVDPALFHAASSTGVC
jgi:hypothetical protein